MGSDRLETQREYLRKCAIRRYWEDHYRAKGCGELKIWKLVDKKMRKY